jgi:hypothetical protein
MRVVVVYKEHTDYARQVETFLGDFKRLTGHDLEVMDPESLPGISFCEAYDLLEYPTIVALSDDGQIQNQWNGLPLPTMSEVSYYV